MDSISVFLNAEREEARKEANYLNIQRKLFRSGSSPLDVPPKENESKTKKLRRQSYASISAEENLIMNPADLIGETLSSFVSRSRSNSNCCRKEPKSGEGSGSAVQDSGFSTETTSSKDGYSALASSGLQGTNISNRLLRDSDDELLNLLDVIFRKTLRFRHKYPSLPNFEYDKNDTYVSTACVPTYSSSFHPKNLRFNTNFPLKQNLLTLNKERDKLLSKVAELESEIIKNGIKISKMEKKLEFITSGNKNLEEQLKAALNQNKELNFELLQRKCDSASRRYARPPPAVAVKRQREACVKRQNSKFVTRNITGGTDKISSKSIHENNIDDNDRAHQFTTCERITSQFNINSENLEVTNVIRDMLQSTTKLNPDLGHKSNKNDFQNLGKLAKCLCKVRETDSNKVAAILLETNPLKLQRHLLTLTVENQAKRPYPEQCGPKSIPLVLKKKTSKFLLHQIDNTSDLRHDCDNSWSFEHISHDKQIEYANVMPVQNEKSIGSICSHNKIRHECEQNIQPTKRLKPSKIPLFGCKTLHSSKSIQKSLSLSTGNIYFKNSRFNQQDSLTSKTREASASVAADSKIVSARSALLKTKRNLITDRFLQLDSLSNSIKNSKTNKYIQADIKTGSTTQLIIQNKQSNPLITFSTRRDTDKMGNTLFDFTEKNLSRKETEAKMDTENKIGYLTQPGVQLLMGGETKSSYGSSLPNSSKNDSIEDETFTDEHIGRVRNLRSTLLGWLKI